MDTNTETDVVRSVIDGFRDSSPSRGATRAFLFKQAQEFLHHQTPHLLTSRKNRRIVARQLAKRMGDRLKAEGKV